jgi:hypothetical protein
LDEAGISSQSLKIKYFKSYVVLYQTSTYLFELGVNFLAFIPSGSSSRVPLRNMSLFMKRRSIPFYPPDVVIVLAYVVLPYAL